eukprot:TRINITY_DN27069_c0_g1_i2.p1 TRINITY_DN27069_c0_g1~~TRINITY_DN27069_c0_g1_i2.p1  ORF type:complete len:405 (+),score=208.95 TRINITY_DN27069_c0_g1_i2:689-1903(+)
METNSSLSVLTSKVSCLTERLETLVGKLSATNGHTAGIYSCSWSADSKRVLTASADKTCKIWNAENGECLTTFTFGEALEDQQLGCLWQGDELISINLGGDVSYLDVNNPSKPKKVLRGHNKFITALAHDASTNSVYTASYDANIVNWDLTTGDTTPMLGKGHTNQVNRMALQGDNLVTIALDDTLRVTNTKSKQYASDAVKFDSPPQDLAVGKKDTSLLVVVILDSIVVLKNGQVVNKLAVKYQPSSVALSVDETTVAVGGKDNNIHLYKLSGNNLTEGPVLAGHRGALSVVKFSPDGKYLGSADLNRDIFVWDLASNSIKIQGWQFHTARVNSLNWAASSQHLVSGSLDGNIYVWSVQDPSKRIAVKNAHQGGVNDTLFINENTVASVGQDCTLKTWTVKFH